VTDARPASTTVVIPTWDRYAGARLTDAVASIATQERSARIVVVNNASTVAMPELDDAEVVRSEVRLTLGAARNLGLAAITTANVIFWDADDLMTPGTLGFLEDELERDPNLVAFGAAIIEEPSGVRHRWPRHWIAHAIHYPRLFALINCVWSMFPTTGATVMRTSAVRACRGYADADSGEDWCLGAALGFRGRFGWSERPGRIYLQHEGSIWDARGGVRHQVAHAAAVRQRLASDPVVPAWLRLGLPVVALAQWGAVSAHLLVSLVRLHVPPGKAREA
jgi:glycosyltransferase involved in cell wall biosynthesis